jgi:hypothetical protein
MATNKDPNEKEVERCHVCKKEFKSGEKAIACDVCMSWSHTKCVNMSADKFKHLQDEQVSWYCAECKGAAKALRNQMIAMRKDMDDMKTRLETLEKTQMTEETVKVIVEKKIQEELPAQLKEVVREEISTKVAAAKRYTNQKCNA